MAILRYADLPRAAGMSVSTVRRMIAAGDFPPPIRLGQRTVGWQAETIDAWLQARTSKATGAAELASEAAGRHDPRRPACGPACCGG